ncbi:MAG TPA: hypothetical protein VFC25_16410 [Verrucomicrobiae bacterium]|nr:hypothetical protein [Verrucomicrobiae bacterium]
MRRFGFLMAAAFLVTLGLATERAQACNWVECAESCDAYCTSKHQTCESSSFTGTCGTMTCSYMCNGGSGGGYQCNGPSCGGSPIFRKQETTVRQGQAREDHLPVAPTGHPAMPVLKLLAEIAAHACP